MKRLFQNRKRAGQILATKLTEYANCPDTIVLALPRGGVPVAWEVAKVLNAPLDICLVRKLGVPSHPELAMGAIARNGIKVLNKNIIKWYKVSQEAIAAVTAKEKAELARRDRLYREDRPLPKISDRTVILIDDGIATGSTVSAAISLLKTQQPKQIVVAIPVADFLVCAQLRTQVDRVICLHESQDLYSISCWYLDFSQTSDAEVKEILARASEGLTSASKSEVL